MTLCIIPARSGSKGIPNKNIKKLGKKPLIEYTIKVAKESNIFNRVVRIYFKCILFNSANITVPSRLRI